MVVRLKSGETIQGALSYNENKVKKEVAGLILASGFSCDIGSLSFSEKINRFQSLIERASVKTKAIHISLNFAPGEILTDENLQDITRNYMEKLGFAEQPYLVYRHDDTGHSHIHIVTTPIKTNGRSINIHNLVQRKSEPARKEIEVAFNLIKADSRKKTISVPLSPITLLPANYGKGETKRLITNIVQQVIGMYKFNSLEELNAILRYYNVLADRGKPGTAMYVKGGLQYSILDSEGFKVSVPIKASIIYGDPTLKTLNKSFSSNSVKKVGSIESFQKVMSELFQANNTADKYLKELAKRNISPQVLPDRGSSDKKLFFIDHVKKVVYSEKEAGITRNQILDKYVSNRPSITLPRRPTDDETNNHETVAVGKIQSFLSPGVLLAFLFTPVQTIGGGGMNQSSKPKRKKKRRYL